MRSSRTLAGIVVGILAAVGLASGVAAQDVYPAKEDVTIIRAQVDRAGNAIIDFEFRCRVAMTVDFGVQVRQYPRKGAAAYGGAGNVWAYVCLPGTPLSPLDGDQYVEGGALLIRPSTGDYDPGIPSGPFAKSYATVGVNIWWTACEGATTLEGCWQVIAEADDPATEDVETPVGDTFWRYQTVKLTGAH